MDLTKIQDGRKPASEALRQVEHVERTAQTELSAELFSLEDLKEIFSFTSAVKLHLQAGSAGLGRGRPLSLPQHTQAIDLKLKALSSRYRCRSTAFSPGESKLDAAGPLIQPFWSIHGLTNGAVGSGILVLLAGLLVLAIVLPVFLWLSAASRKAKHLRGCHTQTLLTFGDNCSVTHVAHIGCRGAKLQAPHVKIPVQDVTLYVAGHQLPAKQDWSNQYFLEIKFCDPISQQTVDDIVAGSRVDDQLAHLGKNATDCFYPGCHVTCAKHRQTEISLKNAS